MLRSHSVSAAAFACVILASARSSAQVAEFRDTEYGFTMAVPAFKKPAEGQSVARLFVTAPAEAGFASNLNVSVQRLTTTLEDFVRLSEEQFRAAGLRVRTKESRLVSGRPAILLDYEGPMGGQSLRWLALAVVLPDKVILATCTAPAATFGSLDQVFRKSLESLKLTP